MHGRSSFDILFSTVYSMIYLSSIYISIMHADRGFHLSPLYICMQLQKCTVLKNDSFFHCMLLCPTTDQNSEVKPKSMPIRLMHACYWLHLHAICSLAVCVAVFVPIHIYTTYSWSKRTMKTSI